LRESVLRLEFAFRPATAISPVATRKSLIGSSHDFETMMDRLDFFGL
jgi:hypothetical protein